MHPKRANEPRLSALLIERISNTNSRKPREVAIGGPEFADPMLGNQCSDMRVMNEIASCLA